MEDEGNGGEIYEPHTMRRKIANAGRVDKAEISLSGFWSKSLLENRGFFGGFFGGFFPACGFFGGFFPPDFSKEKINEKNPPWKPNTKIHE